MEKINFVYPAEISLIIRIIDLNRAEPTCYRTNFHCVISGEQNGIFLVHSTTHNTPYIHPSHDLILELWRIFQNEMKAQLFTFLTLYSIGYF